VCGYFWDCEVFLERLDDRVCRETLQISDKMKRENRKKLHKMET